MNEAEYTLIDCATGLSHGPFDLVGRARDRAEVDNIANWEIINRDGKLVAWSKLTAPKFRSGCLVQQPSASPARRSVPTQMPEMVTSAIFEPWPVG